MRDEIMSHVSPSSSLQLSRVHILALFPCFCSGCALSLFAAACVFVSMCGYEFLLHNYIFEKVTVEIEIGARSQCERRWDGVKMRRDAMQICRLHCLHRLHRPEARLLVQQPILVPDN